MPFADLSLFWLRPFPLKVSVQGHQFLHQCFGVLKVVFELPYSPPPSLQNGVIFPRRRVVLPKEIMLFPLDPPAAVSFSLQWWGPPFSFRDSWFLRFPFLRLSPILPSIVHISFIIEEQETLSSLFLCYFFFCITLPFFFRGGRSERRRVPVPRSSVPGGLLLQTFFSPPGFFFLGQFFKVGLSWQATTDPGIEASFLRILLPLPDRLSTVNFFQIIASPIPHTLPEYRLCRTFFSLR